MIYLDTSVVVALLTPEERSAIMASARPLERLRETNSSDCCRAASSCARLIAVAFARRPRCCRIQASTCGPVMPSIWPWGGSNRPPLSWA